MQILSLSPDDNRFKVRIERDEDLWYLSDVIEAGDYIEGETQRKIDMGDDQKTNTVRKTFFLGVSVEKVDYEPDVKSFRASGRIQRCPDQVSKGRYHSFNVKENDVITVEKASLNTYHIKKLRESTSPPTNVLLFLVDRDTARFGHLTPSGYEVDRVYEGDVEKKAFDEDLEDTFHETVASHAHQVAEDEEYKVIIIASPGFWAENVIEHLSSSTDYDVIAATVSRTDNQGFNELVKRPEVKTALSEEKNRHESTIVKQLMDHIKDGTASYGFEEISQKAEMGAVKTLIVTESFLSDAKDDNRFEKAESVMQTVEQRGGEVTIVSTDDATERIDGLGGIAGVLRWKS